MKTRIISYEEAQKEFPSLVQHIKMADFCLVFDGDVYVDGHIDWDWLGQHMNHKEQLDSGGYAMFNGNLFVRGEIQDDDYGMLLYVRHNVTCSRLHSENGVILIDGDANIMTALSGEYNDGFIEIKGTTNTPFILDNDHAFSLKKSDAILIEHFCNERSNMNFVDAAYSDLDCQKLLSPKVWDEEDEFDLKKFIELLYHGESPFDRR